MTAEFSPFIRTIAASLAYSLIGVVLFALCFLVMRAVTPFSIRKEIEEDQNTALAIVIAAVIIGLSMIISAAIHG
jgi:uncharacterized membrane protein YjfL (UPF0719 family)